MSERDELADVLSDVVPQVQEYADAFGEIADAILAAGYRKPRTIATTEELDALPEGSSVLDVDADVSTKHAGKWHGYEMAPLDSRKFSKCGPFTVLYSPEVSA